MRDGLRTIECPPEIIDQIGGWTTSNVGQKYGRGFASYKFHEWMKQIK